MQDQVAAPAGRHHKRSRAETGQHLAAVAPPGRAVSALDRVSLTRVSWSARSDLDLAEWVAQGQRLGVMGQSAGWWVGDWLKFGNARYGEKYSRAIKITSYDSQTLMNMVWIASRFEVSRRREKLSWSHHVEVAALDLLTQERLLNHAEAERLSVRDMRELVRTEGRVTRGGEDRDEPEGAHAVVCPQCGHSFRAG